MRWLAIAAVVLGFARPSVARPTLDAENLARLGHYDVLTFSDPFGGGLDRGKAIGVIDAKPSEVFRIATDYSGYAEYMPRVRESKLVSGNRDEAFVEVAADLPWPAGSLWVFARYRYERLPGEIYRIRFDMVRGSMKQYQGSLYIEPWSPGKSAITYELVAQPSGLAPKWAVNRGVKRSAGRFVHALRQHINELYRRGAIKARR
jgi:hypothetical protein